MPPTPKRPKRTSPSIPVQPTRAHLMQAQGGSNAAPHGVAPTPPGEGATAKERKDFEKAAAEWNAQAWLLLEDHELVERSASLGLPAELHPHPGEPTGVLARVSQVAELRAAADKIAEELAGKEFVTDWINRHRYAEEDPHFVGPQH